MFLCRNVVDSPGAFFVFFFVPLISVDNYITINMYLYGVSLRSTAMSSSLPPSSVLLFSRPWWETCVHDGDSGGGSGVEVQSETRISAPTDLPRRCFLKTVMKMIIQ